MTSDTLKAIQDETADWRTCSKCKLIKPLDAFYWEAGRNCYQGGYRPDCKSCASKVRSARQKAIRRAIKLSLGAL